MVARAMTRPTKASKPVKIETAVLAPDFAAKLTSAFQSAAAEAVAEQRKAGLVVKQTVDGKLVELPPNS